MYYKTRLKFNILMFVARPRASNKRFRSTKTDFFDSGKKLRTDPKLEEPKLARNQKIKNPIPFGNTKQNATFRHGFGRCLRRFCLIFSTNIENIIFLPGQISSARRPDDFRKNSHPKKHYKTSLKFKISLFLLPLKHENLRFLSVSVIFFASKIRAQTALGPACRF